MYGGFSLYGGLFKRVPLYYIYFNGKCLYIFCFYFFLLYGNSPINLMDWTSALWRRIHRCFSRVSWRKAFSWVALREKKIVLRFFLSRSCFMSATWKGVACVDVGKVSCRNRGSLKNKFIRQRSRYTYEFYSTTPSLLRFVLFRCCEDFACKQRSNVLVHLMTAWFISQTSNILIGRENCLRAHKLDTARKWFLFFDIRRENYRSCKNSERLQAIIDVSTLLNSYQNTICNTGPLLGRNRRIRCGNDSTRVSSLCW